ncbi:pilus assembly protein [Vibrio parahaemolyticus]|uniref:TadE/TadG family type IV pilus assembly protein n=1 Tax=Vibrio parahaemolyticus TaxID=670 RepID=UPI0004D94368|nr:TadE family protein [Vibrio parahaemolyticus]EGQ7874461.1 pilus assembly protein [Vibrio parahaemolyticus]EGR0226086.1 pilus assembly protein [Vibrio parahaemolyticus]EGR0299973.1 pilus assembly protein [Vibrio parahaemolyticus]EGR1360700.1 pilus assembly protein [Vibrio parahaemolyticus]EGR3131525.1 pilus assembly protein [Vibrio parahaemolyticus]
MLYVKAHNQLGKNYQRGLAAVEFILVLPVLLMLSVLVIDVCRAFIQYTEVNKALQNGARYAVVDTYGTLDFDSIADETNIKNVVVYGTPSASSTPIIDYIAVGDIVITPPTSTNKTVTLSATYNYVPIFATLPFSNSSLQFSIGASASMRTGP